MLKKIGGALLFLGIGSIILNLIEYEFILLMWINSWGEATAWTIRIGMIAIGGIMYIAGHYKEKQEKL